MTSAQLQELLARGRDPRSHAEAGPLSGLCWFGQLCRRKWVIERMPYHSCSPLSRWRRFDAQSRGQQCHANAAEVARHGPCQLPPATSRKHGGAELLGRAPEKSFHQINSSRKCMWHEICFQHMLFDSDRQTHPANKLKMKPDINPS